VNRDAMAAFLASRLETVDQVAAKRHGKPLVKPLPAPVLKDKRVKAKKITDDDFRKEIWKLDGGKSRATGKKLARSGTTSWHELGEVDHALLRSTNPDRVYDPSNALLLSKWENRMRKVPCPRAPEFKMFDYSGPDDRRQKQTFVWRDEDGKVTKTRVG
jgi:hypothetical protein